MDVRREKLSRAIRDVPDYPKPGIIFKDITPILQDPQLFRDVVEAGAESLADLKISKIAGIESRGFVLGAAMAHRLGHGFVMIRKKGKLPWKTLRETYALEYGEDSIEIHEDGFLADERVAIVDDVLATGGTAAAAVSLSKRLRADVRAVWVFMELISLRGRNKLEGTLVKSYLQI